MRERITVTKDNLEKCLGLIRPGHFAIDTETTGLRPFHGDAPFGLVYCDDRSSCYVEISSLWQESLVSLWDKLMASADLLFLANAKFDLHHLSRIGLIVPSSIRIHDVAVAGRLIDNSLQSYSLDALASRYLQQRKDDAVKAYIEEHGLWEWVEVPDKDRRDKRMFFDRVPRDILIPYALKDTELTYDLGMFQIEKIQKWDDNLPAIKPKMGVAYRTETEMTRICWEMESRGVRIDRALTNRCLEDEKRKFSEASSEFAKLAGFEFCASSNKIMSALEADGVATGDLPKTDKGNTKFDADTLAGVDSPIAKYVLCCKDAKQAINFYASFLWHSDPSDRLHTDYRQNGTVTWRFSSSNPNLQNLTKPEEGEDHGDRLTPRHCIVPESDEYCFVMMDYKQQEYRLMLEYAEEMGIIEQVKAGLDVHQAMADMTGLSRSQSKTLNFAILYGAGKQTIADRLGVSVSVASDIIADYYRKLPGVDSLIRRVRNKAKHFGHIITWDGRVLKFPLRDMSYRAPNHLIQGGSAAITRRAMQNCNMHLTNKKSFLSLTVHDELIFNLHRSELSLAEPLKQLMVQAYPYVHLPMDVDVSYSWKSLGDKIKGYPQA